MGDGQSWVHEMQKDSEQSETAQIQHATRLIVYCAGAIEAPDCRTRSCNRRRGIRMSVEVKQAGFTPYCPWLVDYGDFADFSHDDYCTDGLSFLERSDAVIVCPVNVERSRGTQMELARARQLGIPIFETLADLKDWGARRLRITESHLGPMDEPALMYAGLPVPRPLAEKCE